MPKGWLPFGSFSAESAAEVVATPANGREVRGHNTNSRVSCYHVISFLSGEGRWGQDSKTDVGGLDVILIIIIKKVICFDGLKITSA